ncbi:protein of unknown function [Brochothrix thermosphacta]|nr:protein of unknown function [Brochothrix thermosphacta]
MLLSLRIYSLTRTAWDGNFHGKLSTNPYVGIVANLFAYEISRGVDTVANLFAYGDNMGRKFSRKIECQSFRLF